MAQSPVQINAPPDMRGRVIGLFNMASLGLRAFSGISVGLLGSLIGIHWSLALAAQVTMIVAKRLLAVQRGQRHGLVAATIAQPQSRSLRYIKADPRELNLLFSMTHVIIRCPRTGSNVQVWVPADATTDQPDTYLAVTCPACTRLHFVNKVTGKLLGDR